MSAAKILIIDDNPTNLKLGKAVLTAEGFEVSTAIDAEEAQTMLDAIRPRLILMDLQLPGMDGLELTRRLRADAVHRSVIIVAMTAYAMKGDEAKAGEAGCAGYIIKPINTRTLAATVVSYLSYP